MSVQEIRKSDRGGAFVHANGIDIHYVEVGQGEPLVLLHGGVVSTELAVAQPPLRLCRPHGRRSDSTSESSLPTLVVPASPSPATAPRRSQSSPRTCAP